MKIHKVSAFTIMEIIIAMMISAILISITFTAYAIFFRSYQSFNLKNKEMATILKLDELIKRDFRHADMIGKNQDGIYFKSDQDSITYTFKPDYILRVSTIMDTFKVSSGDNRFSFEQQPVMEVKPEREQNRIDDMELVLLYQSEKMTYHYHKTYSSANLFQRIPYALD